MTRARSSRLASLPPAEASCPQRQERPRARACASVLMVGTDPAGRGGIRAVVRGYMDGGLLDRIECRYVTTHRYGPPWMKIAAALGGWARVAVLLRTMPSPLVHVQLASRASFWRKSMVCLLARLAHRPYLLHVHGGEFLQFYERESGALAQSVIRAVLARAALLIALSEEWRARLLRICPTARVEVLTNAVALPILDGARSPAMSDPTVLFLGELSRGKGVFDLVHAFAGVCGRVPRVKLILGGVGAVAEVQRLAAQLGIGSRVGCAGWLDTERKRAGLAAATLFALPSYAEGMPMALLEAMSWGLPVIATPVGGIPQLVSSGVNGLLVAPGDTTALTIAMTRLLSDVALRERLGRAARETVAARFSLDATLEQLCGIYRRFGIGVRGTAGADR